MSWRRGQTYGQDLRDRVLAATGSVREVAARFGVSPAYVAKARLRRDRDGSTQPRPQKPPAPWLLVHLHDAIAARVAAEPSATIAEIREWLLRVHRVSVSMATVCKTLQLLGLTRKKSRSGPPSRRARTLPRRGRLGVSCSPV